MPGRVIIVPHDPERTKRYFRETPGEPRTHNHVRRAGSWAEPFRLLFRDDPRTHPEDAARVADVKRGLARKHEQDRVGYTNAKAPFIWRVMASADVGSQEVGWTFGPSDT